MTEQCWFSIFKKPTHSQEAHVYYSDVAPYTFCKVNHENTAQSNSPLLNLIHTQSNEVQTMTSYLYIVQNITVLWVKKPKIMAKKPAKNVNCQIVFLPSTILTLCLSCECCFTHCVTCLVRKCGNLC